MPQATAINRRHQLMHGACPWRQVLHSVRAPQHLLARPYLRPVYDDPFFVVANLWRLYAGWYDGKVRVVCVAACVWLCVCAWAL